MTTTRDDSGRTTPWWSDAVIYQVYIRSFADANGDGVGDVDGIRSRLPYLRDLGVDAIWINPWYPSPMADAGYDVSDYRGIDPLFGTLADAEALIAEAHGNGLRVIIDLVPNHTSDRHPWFEAALAAGPGSPERGRYWFRPGRGENGEMPPNDWRSNFGGSAWQRVTEPDGTPGEWYLHLFAPEQPDLYWQNPEVREEFESILRFWLDRDVDGFRIDVAHGLVKDPSLPDLGYTDDMTGRIGLEERPVHPYWDQDGVVEIYRAWRRISDSYDGSRAFVAEAWVPDPDRLARYVTREGLHTAFNFEYLTCPWDASRMRKVIDITREAHDAVGAPPTWVLSNHDVIRHVTRYGREARSSSYQEAKRLLGTPSDLELGTRRARAAALLMLALPGGAYVYQGEELGLGEVEDLPAEALQDPTWIRSGHTDRGRDGCRVPIPWSGREAPFGFSGPGATAEPWLPQPSAWKSFTVEAEDTDPESMLNLYRSALRIRRGHAALSGGMTWDEAEPDVLSFVRAPGFRCVVNLSPVPVELPAHTEVLLASGPFDGERLPTDTAVWLAG